MRKKLGNTRYPTFFLDYFRRIFAKNNHLTFCYLQIITTSNRQAVVALVNHGITKKTLRIIAPWIPSVEAFTLIGRPDLAANLESIEEHSSILQYHKFRFC